MQPVNTMSSLPQHVTSAPSLPILKACKKTYIFSRSFQWPWSTHSATHWFQHFNCSLHCNEHYYHRSWECYLDWL